MSKPGPEVGCDAKVIGYEYQLNDMKQINSEIDPLESTMELQQAAFNDYKNISAYFRRAAKRKFVPEASAPLEAWWMVFHPNYRVKWRQMGVGAERLRVSTCNVRWYIIDLLINIRRLQWAPLDWSLARACKLPKKSSKMTYCSFTRLIFAFDPFGKAYFAQLLSKDGRTYSAHVHAYLRHRRRESAVMTAMVVPYKLNRQKFHCFNSLHDKTNAFLSMGKEHAAISARELVEACVSKIVHNHISLACFRLDCPDGDLTLLPKNGILPGSPLVVRVWIESFEPIIHKFRSECDKFESMSVYHNVISPCGKIINVALTAFADDTHKLLTAPADKPIALVTLARKSHDALDHTLTPFKIAQNIGKREIVPQIASKGRNSVLYYLFAMQPCKGTIVHDARYLGSRLTMQASNASEREHRLAAICRGYYEMGQFWYRCRNESHLRAVFIAKVRSPAFSGLTAFAWKDSDSRILDRQIMQFARRALRDRAYVKNDNDLIVCSLSNVEIMVRWKLCPHCTELAVLRISMYQDWAMHTHAFLQPIAALFGCWATSALTEINVFGSIKNLNASNPWLKQFHYDLQLLCFVEQGSCFLQLLDGHYAHLFDVLDSHKELVEFFCLLNPRELRTHSYGIAISPPRPGVLKPDKTTLHHYKSLLRTEMQRSAQLTALSSTVTEDDIAATDAAATAKLFRCPIVVDGIACSAEPMTWRKLRTHIVFVHSIRCIIRACTAVAVCPWCKSSFKNVNAAKQHAVKAYNSGVCVCG